MSINEDEKRMKDEMRLGVALSTRIITMGGKVTYLDDKFVKGKVYGNSFTFNGKTYHLKITDEDYQI